MIQREDDKPESVKNRLEVFSKNTKPVLDFYREMGILKDHISIISFLKPGIIKISSENEENNFYVDDGIVEFKDNTLSILTSNIFDIKNSDKSKIQDMIKEAEKDLSSDKLDDQKRFIISQKVEVLKSLSLN